MMGQAGWRASVISTPFELAASARTDSAGMSVSMAEGKASNSIRLRPFA
jgi:hypothetical protein